MAGNTSVTREYNRIFTIMKDEAQPLLFDNISTRTAYLFRLKDMGAIVRTGGKEHFRFNVLKELPTTEAYTDLETITPVRSDPYTSGIFEWKQLDTPVQISGLDMIKTGPSAEPQMLEAMFQAAEISMRDALGGSSIGVFSDGGESDLNKVSGLQNFLTTSTTTGTVGNISRTNAFWQHQSQNVSNNFSTNGLNRFRTLYRECNRFDENVDTIVLTGSTLDNFELNLTSSFQVNLPLSNTEMGPADQRMLDAGFGNIRYKNAIVFDDSGVPANFGYFLNISKYIRLMVHEGRDAEMGDFIKSRDKDDLVTFVLWAGNQLIYNLARNGVLLNADTN